MRYYKIEVDERIWNYLKKHAEPFQDTPNSVLYRLIFHSHSKTNQSNSFSNTVTEQNIHKDIDSSHDSTSDLPVSNSKTNKTLPSNKTSILEQPSIKQKIQSSENNALTRLNEIIASFKTSDISQALAQILEVLYEIKVNGFTRKDATQIVAQKRGTSPFTVMDKYCRQLNKKAHEIDELLLSDSGMEQFKALLIDKFPKHAKVINEFFQELFKAHV